MATVDQNYSKTERMQAARWYGKGDVRSLFLASIALKSSYISPSRYKSRVTLANPTLLAQG